jgi:hypothetical protein
VADIERFELGNNIGAAYGLVGRNLGALAILLVAWTAVVLIVGFAGLAGIRLAVDGIPELATFATNEEVLALVSLIPAFAAGMAAISAVIVAWHRRIVTGTRTSNPFSVGLDAILRYIACVVVVFGIAFSPILLAGLGAAAFLGKPAGDGPAFIVVLVLFALVIACLIVTMRLSLLFPATAVGDRTMTITRSWQLTKGCSWRLFWGSFLCALPFSIAGNIVEKLLEVPGLAEPALAVGLVVLGVVVEMFGYFTVAAFISLAYIQLTGLDGAADRPPASHFS